MTDTTIVVEDVRKQFGEVVALDGVSFGVEAGTVLGLLGPNGAGKTTAVRILTTIIPLEQGHASVLGIDVARHPQSVRLRIGLAGQYAAVDEVLTGRENLRLVGALSHLPRRLTEDRASELLERFGLADAADRSLKTYSGGMRRRLDLAAALVHRPPILFLDEPDDGTGPGVPSRALAGHRGAGRRRHHGAAHDAVPRGGGPAGRQHRGHRPRPGHRRGHRDRAQVPHRLDARRGHRRGRRRGAGPRGARDHRCALDGRRHRRHRDPGAGRRARRAGRGPRARRRRTLGRDARGAGADARRRVPRAHRSQHRRRRRGTGARARRAPEPERTKEVQR